MRSLVLFALLLVAAPSATAQILFQGGSFQTSVAANTPGCSDDLGGGVGVSPATASCVTGGYAAVANGAAGFSTHPNGGEVTASGEATATSVGPPSQGQSSANSTNNAGANWKLSVPTHYSLVTDISGGAFVNFSGPGVAFPPPPSGILTGVDYGLNASVAVSATARDSNGAETVTAVPQAGAIVVTFAEVNSPTLIMGTVLAGGSPMPSLLIEALEGPVVVATTRTGNDSSYLLDDLPASVTLRISDPTNVFASETSSLLFPPTTFDADLEMNPSVPVLSDALLSGLALLLALMGITHIRFAKT
jgi:hypothetical protein